MQDAMKVTDVRHALGPLLEANEVLREAYFKSGERLRAAAEAHNREWSICAERVDRTSWNGELKRDEDARVTLDVNSLVGGYDYCRVVINTQIGAPTYTAIAACVAHVRSWVDGEIDELTPSGPWPPVAG